MRMGGFAVALAACGRIGFDPLPDSTVDAPAPKAVVQISSGGRAACARLGSGDVWCWGDNRALLLGANLTADQSPVPVKVLLPGAAIEIEVDDHNAFARLASGGIVGWGINDRGQLGPDGPALVPVLIANSAAIEMTSATGLLCVVRPDHSVACIGSGTEGALGDASMFDRSTLGPATISGVTALSGGTIHVCALLDTGATRCWGRNLSGQLGDGSVQQRNSPVDGPVGPYTSIAAGDNFTCAVRTDHGVDCWGDNLSFQLGMTGFDMRATAAQVPGVADATQVVGGAQHACALLADRTVECWGNDTQSQLGDTLGDSTPTPRRVGISNVVELSCRTDLSTCARTATGEVYCWGDNEFGELGNGQMGGSIATPQRVLGLP